MSHSIITEQLEAVSTFEQELDIPSGFFRSLLDSDDWSFIIKNHAIIESSIGNLLCVVFNECKIDNYLLRMDLSGGRHSKISLLKELKLISREEEKFIKGLSNIRNRLVHNIRYVRFDLAEYVRNNQNDFICETCAIFFDCQANREKKKAQKLDILSNPKRYIWKSSLQTIAISILRVEKIALERETEGLRRNLSMNQAFAAKRLLDEQNALT